MFLAQDKTAVTSAKASSLAPLCCRSHTAASSSPYNSACIALGPRNHVPSLLQTFIEERDKTQPHQHEGCAQVPIHL